jgi:hypothetical protein
MKENMREVEAKQSTTWSKRARVMLLSWKNRHLSRPLLNVPTHI